MNNSDLITRKMPSFSFSLFILSPAWCLGSRFRRYFRSRNSPWEIVSQVLSFLLVGCETWVFGCGQEGVSGTPCLFQLDAAWCGTHCGGPAPMPGPLCLWLKAWVWNSPSHADGCHDNFVVLHHRLGLITAQKSHYTPTAVDFKPHYSLGALCALSRAQLSPPFQKMNF